MSKRARSRSTSVNGDLINVSDSFTKLINKYKEVYLHHKQVAHAGEANWELKYNIMEQLLGSVFEVCEGHCEKLSTLCSVYMSRDPSPYSDDGRDSKGRRRRGGSSPVVLKLRDQLKELAYGYSNQLPYSVSKIHWTSPLLAEDLSTSKYEKCGYNGLYEYGTIPCISNPKLWSSGSFLFFLGCKDGEFCFACISSTPVAVAGAAGTGGMILFYSVDGPKEIPFPADIKFSLESMGQHIQTLFPQVAWKPVEKVPSLLEVLQAIERKCEPFVRSMDIGLVFSKPGQSTVDIFNNKTRDETSSFVRFKEVMGVPDAFEKENVFDDIFITSKIRWFPATSMSDSEKAQFFGSVESLIIFTDSSAPVTPAEISKFAPNSKFVVIAELWKSEKSSDLKEVEGEQVRRQQRVQLGREESRRRLSSGPGKEFISPDLRNGSPGRRDRERSKSIDRVRGKSKDRDRSPSNERPEEKELIEANGNRYRIVLLLDGKILPSSSFPYFSLPSSNYLYPEEILRDLILTKIFNATWKIKESNDYMLKHVDDRRTTYLKELATILDKKWAAKNVLKNNQNPASLSFSVRRRWATESSSGSDSNSPPPVRAGITRTGKRSTSRSTAHRRGTPHSSLGSTRSNDATSAGSQQEDSGGAATTPTALAKSFSDSFLDSKLFPRFDDDEYEYGVLSKESVWDEWKHPLLVTEASSDMVIEPPSVYSPHSFTYHYGLTDCRDLYSEKFAGSLHFLFFAYLNNQFSIVAIKHSQKFYEEEKNGLFNHPTGWESFHVPEHALKSQPKAKKWLANRYPQYRFKTVKHATPLLIENISKIEKMVAHKIKKFKIGVLYMNDIKKHHVVDLVENPCRLLSPCFLKFCKGMGIPDQFNEDNEFDDVYKDVQIQWFLSSSLSSEEGRKFIGNLQCIIIFKEDPAPLDTATMGSLGKLNQFFMVVEPIKKDNEAFNTETVKEDFVSLPEKFNNEPYYRVGVFQKKELQSFEPQVPLGYLFNLQTLRDFLLTKAHNGMVAVRKKSALSTLMFSQPRSSYINELVHSVEKEWAQKMRTGSSSPVPTPYGGSSSSSMSSPMITRTSPSGSPPNSFLSPGAKRVHFPFSVPYPSRSANTATTTTTIIVTSEPSTPEENNSPMGTPTLLRTMTLATITHSSSPPIVATDDREKPRLGEESESSSSSSSLPGTSASSSTSKSIDDSDVFNTELEIEGTEESSLIKNSESHDRLIHSSSNPELHLPGTTALGSSKTGCQCGNCPSSTCYIAAQPPELHDFQQQARTHEGNTKKQPM